MAAGVLAQGGPDLLATIEGRWTTELGAARIIRRNGGTLARLMDLRLSRIDPDRAAPGDPCGLVDETRGLVLGLVGTGLLVFAAQPSGVEYRERWTATHAWSF